MIKSENFRNAATSTAILFICIVLIGIQFVPVDKTNPPPLNDLQAPEEVMAILKPACFDCHSSETVWPWYGHVAPVSWLLAKHVREGREELNFSDFDTLPLHLRRKVFRHVANGDMPMKNYTFMHPDSKLTDSQIEVLHAWSQPEPAAATAQSE